MVTGGGGSIGSELCRQIAPFSPSRLVILDHAESELFRIHRELPDVPESRHRAADRRHSANGQLEQGASAVISSTSIFHAAAYKHVPMMEAHLLEAVKNNVFGTRNVVRAAYRNSVARLPHDLVGQGGQSHQCHGSDEARRRAASSPPCRLRTKAQPTKFVSVRFGNVLGSNGSVVPLFQQQIAAGGP